MKRMTIRVFYEFTPQYLSFGSGIMDGDAVHTKISTKERIIRETFLLMSSQAYSNISLSQIAARVGISKTAIFRHFANKEELLGALKERFIDDVAACFLKDSGPCASADTLLSEACLYRTWKKLVSLSCVKPEYMCFFVRMLASSIDFSAILVDGLKKRGVPIPTHETDNVQSITEISYVYTTTFFCLMKYWHFSETADTRLPPPSEFADILFSFLKNGWNVLQPLSAETLGRLDGLCRFSGGEALRPLDRFFMAFAQVVRTNGFPNVTVELIAAELGMAKSSLYGYFKNKGEMIRNLIEEETVYIIEVVEKKFSRLKELSFSERVYCILRISIEYILLRPEILSVATWLCLRNEEFPSALFNHINETGVFRELIALHSDQFPAVGLPVGVLSLLEWLVTVSISQVVSGLHRHVPDAALIDSARLIYGVLLRGVRNVAEK